MHFNDQISEIIGSLKSSWGTDFYSHLLLQLNSLIKANYLFIAKLDDAKTLSTTVCLVAGDEVVDNFSYDLVDTPCADVSNDAVCVYPTGICELYPKDQLLLDMGINAYIGTPIYASNGSVVGIIVALYSQELSDTDWIVNLFTLFSGRIAAEMERQEKEDALIKLNSELESKIEERTYQLSVSLEKLKRAQDKFIEQEKMASLGGLVAGVAHEINTPLGVAILCNSNINEHALKLQRKVNEGALTKSELLQSTDAIVESSDALTMNLNRAANLVADFKLVAVERNSDDLSTIELNSWFNSLLSSLQVLTKKRHIEITFNQLPCSLTVETIPSKLAQVVSNIVTNAVNHAFDDASESPSIDISLIDELEQLIIEIKDNGVGMNKELLSHIFEPFYTTKRSSGGTGLGLNIVYSIVNGVLNGEIEVKSSPKEGSAFIIKLPKNQ